MRKRRIRARRWKLQRQGSGNVNGRALRLSESRFRGCEFRGTYLELVELDAIEFGCVLAQRAVAASSNLADNLRDA